MKKLLRKLLFKLRDKLYDKIMNEKDDTDYSDIVKLLEDIKTK